MASTFCYMARTVAFFCLFSLLNTKRILGKKTGCDSNIYCHGPLLHLVQLSHIYSDDKTFVDRPLQFSPAQVLQNFSLFIKAHGSTPESSDIQEFVDANFHPNDHEFERWTPQDWHANPKFLSYVKDKNLKRWGNKLHGIWKVLGRKIKEICKLHPDRFSILYVSRPFIVPGGRFREFYYWDSYWIQRGLLHSEMYETVKGMIRNFLDLVESIGFVPNGGRIYYQRSQPPLLISMMKSYFDATQDFQFLYSSLPILEKELKFWLKHRMVSIYHKGEKRRLARYSSEETGPRPESYSDDYELAKSLESEEDKEELYKNIQGAAESGWDFSSRWFLPKNSKLIGNKTDTKTLHILPVDLNSILFLNAKTLSEFFHMVGHREKANIYNELKKEFYEAIQTVFWDEKLGAYFDYDMINMRRIKKFYPSSFFPVWTGVETSSNTVSRILSYATSNKVFDFPGGVPASLSDTGEQWDFPNGWPPLIHIMIESLSNSELETAHKHALSLAEKWVRSNYKAFYRAEPYTMFEKYDVSRFGFPGSGGEYNVVAGFGWTNGIILNLLSKYGSVLTL